MIGRRKGDGVIATSRVDEQIGRSDDDVVVARCAIDSGLAGLANDVAAAQVQRDRVARGRVTGGVGRSGSERVIARSCKSHRI